MQSGLGHLLTRGPEAACLAHVCSSNEVSGVYRNRQEDRDSSQDPKQSTISPGANTKLSVHSLSYTLGSFWTASFSADFHFTSGSILLAFSP